MTTARDIINSAYRKIGVLGQGQSLSASEINDALEALNDMIESWSLEGALIYTETKETFNLTGAVSYTIGSGQTFDTELPNKIVSAYITENGEDTPVNIISQNSYSEIADKDELGSTQDIYFDGNYPTANIYVWPVKSGITLTLFTEKSLNTFDNVTTDFAMPPAYKRALKYNLAVEVAPEFEKEASRTVKNIAKNSLKLIKAQNKKNNKDPVSLDPIYLRRGRFDIRTGYHK